MIAKIAVSSAVYAIDKPYSYRIPDALLGDVCGGKRVMVPFGRANRRTEGIVLSVEEGSEEKLKPIERVLDEEPILDEAMLRLAAFVRERYFCTFYDAIKAMLPAGLWYARHESYQIAELHEDVWDKLSKKPEAAAVHRTVAELGGNATEEELHRVFEQQPLKTALQELTKRGYLKQLTQLQRRTGDKTERIVSLAVSVEEALDYAARKQRSAAMQAAVLRLLAGMPEACAKEICYFTGATNATLNRLEKLGYVKFQDEEVFRRPEIQVHTEARPIELNPEQQKVYDGLLQQAAQPEPGCALLYGVTGSGKTAVYLRLIQKMLEQGKGALLMVPEIALTPQLLSLFTAHFGDLVAVLHSSLRVTERYDEYKRIRSGKARLVIGTRSAVFAPVQDLGLIIVDEEQEHSYKSENSPRYHAREVAQYRGRQTGALVLLGSATPSVESMYRAKTGTFSLYTLPNRYNGRPLPKVRIADLKQELKDGNSGALSWDLCQALEQTVAAGRQAILFLNRRGSSRLMMCVDCGYVPECPRCSVHMTYHAANRRMMCHYCGHSEPVSDRCPECGSAMKMVGTGTQRVQQELSERFPDMKTIRMDADTVTAVNTHEAILSKFRKEKIPVLIGTQMVTKGLDFENVTLVGVLDADLSLYVDSFRATETTFSMLTQVVGRAGRGETEGEAIVQTLTPDNRVIRLAAVQDYDNFYSEEIEMRSLRNCPPFSDLITLNFAGGLEEQVLSAAGRFRARLAAVLSQAPYDTIRMQILGPAPAQIVRVNNVFRYRLTLNVKADRQVRRLISALIREAAGDKQNRGVTVFADLNAFD